jgi:hypothetical protein
MFDRIGGGTIVKRWILILAVAGLSWPVAGISAGPQLQLMFKPLRSVRVDSLVQVELDVKVTSLGPAPITVILTYIGTPSLDTRYSRSFGSRDIAKGASANLRELITVPAAEVARWEREQVMPRFRVEYFGPAGRGIAVLEAVPAGPADQGRNNPGR